MAGLVGSIVQLIVMNSLSIFVIVIGVLHHAKEECTAEPHLAFALIGLGFMALLASIFEACVSAKTEKKDAIEESKPLSPPAEATDNSGTLKFLKAMRYVTRFANSVVLIYLCYLIYKLMEGTGVIYDDKEDVQHYCNQWLYTTALVSAIFAAIGFAILFIASISTCFCTCFSSKK